MATNKIEILVDPNASAVEQAMLSMVAAARAAGDSNAAIQNKVYDANGKLVRLDLIHNGANPTAALDATAANPSVVDFSSSIPAPTFLFDVTGMTSAVVIPVAPAGKLEGEKVQTCVTTPSGPGGGLAVLGQLVGDGAFGTYQDFGLNPNPSVLTHGYLRILHVAAAPLVFTNGQLTITADGGPIPLDLTGNITVPAVLAGSLDHEHMQFYIDANKKVYLAFHQAVRAGLIVDVVLQRTYTQAVAAGAL